jgi:hypothetical protein
MSPVLLSVDMNYIMKKNETDMPRIHVLLCNLKVRTIVRAE